MKNLQTSLPAYILAIILTIAVSSALNLSSLFLETQAALNIINLDCYDEDTDFTGAFADFEGMVYYDNADPVLIDSGALVSTNDTITFMRIDIPNIIDTDDDEVLAVTTTGSITVDATNNGSDGVLDLTGTGTAADYQAVLRTLTYENEANTPSTSTPRDIRVYVNDLNDFDIFFDCVYLNNSPTTGSISLKETHIEVQDDFDMVLIDKDRNLDTREKDSIGVTVENEDTNEVEYVILEETGDNTGEFEGELETEDDDDSDDCGSTSINKPDNSGKLCVDEKDDILITYADPLDSAGADSTDVEYEYRIKEDNSSSSSSTTTTTTVTSCASNEFPDSCNHSLAEYIQSLKNAGIVEGFSDGNYYPDREVTRAQMATFVREAFGFATVSLPTNCFPDVSGDNPHYSDIQTLCDLSIVGGFSDGTFRPDEMVKRDEVTKFVAGALIQRGNTIPFYETSSFPDVPTDNAFLSYIEFLSQANVSGDRIINGYSNGDFGPRDNLTRGQLAKIVDLARKY